jgi:hypothetical protein
MTKTQVEGLMEERIYGCFGWMRIVVRLELVVALAQSKNQLGRMPSFRAMEMNLQV